MKNAERIVIVATILVLVGGAAWGVWAVQAQRADFRARVAAGEFEIRDEPLASATTDYQAGDEIPEEVWRTVYPVTYPMRVGEVLVQASVADTLSQRIKGLSDTPYLPRGVVKLFAFGVPGSHSIWMKDMNYALDIIWADEDGTIVHIAESVSPDTYNPDAPRSSETFESLVDSWFVVETNAGFVSEHGIVRGDAIALPTSN